MGFTGKHLHCVEVEGRGMPAFAVGTCDTSVINDETSQHRAATSCKQTV